MTARPILDANALVARRNTNGPKVRCAVCRKYFHRKQMGVGPRRDHQPGIMSWCTGCLIAVPPVRTWYYLPADSGAEHDDEERALWRKIEAKLAPQLSL